jgi:ribosomal protein S18 acetylase RimI-like enzyme
LIAVRNATQGDRDDILSFCANTFSWGDYIEQVWELWLHDSQGKLFVAETEGKKVGLAHVAACPDSKDTWLEGVRVHPSHRRSGLASALLGRMLEFGEEKGATRALAIVAKNNAASQRMMERNGFSAISEWAYYSTGDPIDKRPSNARLASADELDAILEYLEASRTYELSAKTYVKAWHWYALDHASLKALVSEGRVVISGSPVAGMAVLNRPGYWNRKNILQIVYLDSQDEKVLGNLLAFATNLYLDEKYERLHVLCQQDEKMTSIIEGFEIQESEQFLLYSKVLNS